MAVSAARGRQTDECVRIISVQVKRKRYRDIPMRSWVGSCSLIPPGRNDRLRIEEQHE